MAPVDPIRACRQRLADLEAAGRPLPFRYEDLDPAAALDVLAGRDDSVSRLQTARFLLELGRDGEAGDVLSGLGELPAGLDRVRSALLSRVSEPPVPEPAAAFPPAAGAMATRTMAELYLAQGDPGRAAAILREVLEREPGDGRARALLRELEREPENEIAGAGLAAAPLAAWLGRVREWRRVLGV